MSPEGEKGEGKKDEHQPERGESKQEEYPTSQIGTHRTKKIMGLCGLTCPEPE